MLCRELQSTVHWREGIRLQGQLIPSNHSRLHVPGWRLHQPQRHRRQEHLRRKVCGRELPTEAHWIWLVFCSVLYPSSIHGLGTPWTYFFYLSLSCVILTDFHGESCPRLDVVHPGRAGSSSPSCTWHCSLHYLFSPGNSLVSSWCDHSMLASLLSRCLTVPSLLQLCQEPTHLFSLLSTKPRESFPVLPSQGVKTCFVILRVQLSQPYVETGDTSAFASPRVSVAAGSRVMLSE